MRLLKAANTRWVWTIVTVLCAVGSQDTIAEVSEDIYWHSPYIQAGLNGPVRDMIVFEDRLIIGGEFTSYGDVHMSRIGAWDGTKWAPLGDGFNGQVLALAIYKGQLIAGGSFTQSGTTQLDHLAAWNGDEWQAMSIGVDGAVHSMATNDTNWLLVAGNFSRIDATRGGWLDGDRIRGGGVIAFDGNTWVNLADETYRGNIEFKSRVRSIVGYKDHFYAVGAFEVDETPFSSLSIQPGQPWRAFTGGDGESQRPGPIHGASISIVGTQMFICGNLGTDLRNDLSDRFISIDLETQEPQAELIELDRPVMSVAEVDDQLYAAGYFNTLSGCRLSRLGTNYWEHSPTGGFNGPVLKLINYRGELFAGGQFGQAGGKTAPYMAVLRNGSWDSVSTLKRSGTPFVRPPGLVFAKEGVLYTSDWQTPLTHIDRLPSKRRKLAIAPRRWQFTTQTYTYKGQFLVGQRVFAGNQLTPIADLTFDSKYGPGTGQGLIWCYADWDGDLFAGGWFDSINDRPVLNVARFDGSEWTPVGSGLLGTVELWSYPIVKSLLRKDEYLYAGGFFELESGERHSIARWSRNQDWAPVGSGLSDYVVDLEEYQGDIYATGHFTQDGAGQDLSFIARWDGSEWHPLESGLAGPGYALHKHNGYLVVGGDFPAKSASQSPYVTAWDGQRWIALGSGTNRAVSSLIPLDDHLVMVGDFTRAGDQAANFIAYWEDPHRTSTSVHVSQENGEIRVTWSAGDRPVDFGGFNVYRSTSTTERVRLTEKPLVTGSRFEVRDPHPPSGDISYEVQEIQLNGTVAHTEVRTLNRPPEATSALNLSPVFPNPMQGSTTIRFSLTKSAFTSVSIFDTKGRKIRSLIDREYPVGTFELTWDGMTETGAPASSGVYFLRLTSANETRQQRIVKVN